MQRWDHHWRTDEWWECTNHSLLYPASQTPHLHPPSHSQRGFSACQGGDQVSSSCSCLHVCCAFCTWWGFSLWFLSWALPTALHGQLSYLSALLFCFFLSVSRWCSPYSSTTLSRAPPSSANTLLQGNSILLLRSECSLSPLAPDLSSQTSKLYHSLLPW